MTTQVSSLSDQDVLFMMRLKEAGLSDEQQALLTDNPARLREWIDHLPSLGVPRSNTSIPIAEVFGSDSALLNILRREEIQTLGELASCTADEVAAFRQVGRKRVAGIETVLASYGLRFSEPVDNGARRIPYRSRRYGRSTCRRDKAIDKPLRLFVELESDAGRNELDRERMTAREFLMTDEQTHRYMFSSLELQRIRTWITRSQLS